MFEDDYNLNKLVAIRPKGFDFQFYTIPRLQYLYRDNFEPLSVRLIHNMVRNCDLFIDVGAHHGFYSLVASGSNPSLDIISMEPIDENCQILRKNLTNNNRSGRLIKTIQAAAHSKDGQLIINQSSASDNCGVYIHPVTPTVNRLEVNSFKLDNLVNRKLNNRILVKIDTEGSELDVMSGFKSTISQCADIAIMLEINPVQMVSANKTFEDYLLFFKKMNFHAFAINDASYSIYKIENYDDYLWYTTNDKSPSFNIILLKKQKSMLITFFSHDSYFSGANRSLMDLIISLTQKWILCNTVIPGKGEFQKEHEKNGIAYTIAKKDNSDRFKWKWIHSFESVNVDKELHEVVSSTYEWIGSNTIEEIKHIKPDIIYSNTIVSPWGAVVAHKLCLPHALSVHEYGLREYGINFLFDKSESMMALYDFSSLIFTTTNDVGYHLFPGDPENKIVVAYEGIDEDLFTYQDNKEKSELEISPENNGSVNIGTFAYIFEGKGQLDLVKAVISLLNNGINITAYIVGAIIDKEYYQEIRNIIKDSGFDDRFVFTGNIDNPFKLMKQMDIITSNSWMEGAGRTLIEASFLRIPFIYPNTGGPKELYTNNVHGYSYKVGNHQELEVKIKALINDPQKAKEMSENAYINAKALFNPEQYANTHIRSFRQLLVNQEIQKSSFEKLSTILKNPVNTSTKYPNKTD